MSIVAVIDPYDDRATTLFVNRLHDLSRRRAVVHAPASSPGLVDEILRALAGHVPAAGDARPTPRRRWAAAWIAAYDRLDLVIYGAWRLKAGDLRWLAELVRTSARVRLWLVFYEQAANRAELSASADTVWSWDQFRDHWHTRLRNQRCRRRRERRARGYSARNVALDVPVAQDPWPWAMSELLLARDPRGELKRGATDIARATTLTRDHLLQVAQLVHELFAYWRSRPQRMFVLTIIKNTLFCEYETWFDWDPRLLDVTVAPRAAEPVAPWPSADPEPIAEALIAENARHLPDGCDFRIGRDGSHVTLQTGDTVAIAGPDRPALRARIAIDGASGQLRHRPLLMRDAITRPCDPDRGLDRQALPKVTRMLDMRRLHTRVGHDAPHLRLHAAEPRDRLAPDVLDYQHVAMLSGLLQWLPPRRNYADVLRGNCDDDTRQLRDLQRYGLVIAGYEGQPELVDWLRALWCDRVHPGWHDRPGTIATTIRSALFEHAIVDDVDRGGGR